VSFLLGKQPEEEQRRNKKTTIQVRFIKDFMLFPLGTFKRAHVSIRLIFSNRSYVNCFRHWLYTLSEKGVKS
jgi:hypothetical protein